MAIKSNIWHDNQFSTWRPNFWDVLALILLFITFMVLAYTAREMTAPYKLGEHIPITLSLRHLSYYALRTTLRMILGLMFSLLFTFTIGTMAAKNKHMERFIIPLIDILQSVPVLGFLSITIIGFISLFPNSLLGPECAAIFVIFTAQAWNICLGFYQSLKTVPHNLREASAMLNLSPWQQFWRIEVPFAIPSLIWNIMMSLSGSWFFIVASEAITVNKQHILLPGVGSYIALAIQQKDKLAIVYAITAMFVVILLFDQILFRPLLQWGEKFKGEIVAYDTNSYSLLTAILRRTRLLYYLGGWFSILCNGIINIRANKKNIRLQYAESKRNKTIGTLLYICWYGMLIIFCFTILLHLVNYIFQEIQIHEALYVIVLGLYTSIRIIVLIILCSLIWVPIGVWIGLRPRVAYIARPIAQFFASFPANLLFPVVVMLIVKYKLNIQIWTTPLMILGTQWYILFNVIAGASVIPKDLVHAADNFSVKHWLRWRRFIFPAIFPYFITGAITAAGGAWNASIVAEVVSWGKTNIIASGLGAYISQVTQIGDFPRIALGLSVMCLYVFVFNRLIWQPLYNMAEKRYQIE